MKKTSTHVVVALPTFTQSPDLLLETLSNEIDLFKLLKAARARQEKSGELMLFNLLCDNVNPDATPPFAALSALGAEFDIEKSYWLRIDPIELIVDAGNICLVGRDHLQLTPQEANSLLYNLNDLLKEDQLKVIAGSPSEWFLSFEQDPCITTFPLSSAIAKDIKAFLPTGKRGKWWHKITTELQMILYTHPINQLRQSQNEPVINSVWVWGEGDITESYKIKPYNTIWSDNSLVKGIARLSGVNSIYPSQQFNIDHLSSKGDYFITFNHYELNHDYLLATLKSLLNFVLERKINELSICFGNGTIYSCQAPKRFFNFL